jgi:lipopolysaccharide biosynthesis glycosyltransferase
MQWATGLVTAAITHSEHSPYFARYTCFDRWPQADSVFHFDADVWAVKKFDCRMPDHVDFAGVLEKPERIKHAAALCDLDPNRYFNAGVWWASRRLQGAFKRVLASEGVIMPFHDQNALNVAISASTGHCSVWGDEWNRILNPVRDAPIETAHERNKDAMLLHYTAMGGRRLHELEAMFRRMK